MTVLTPYCVSTSITHFSLQFCVQYCIDVKAVVEINSIQEENIENRANNTLPPDGGTNNDINYQALYLSARPRTIALLLFGYRLPVAVQFC